MVNKDEDLFLQEMRGVTPLPADDKVSLKNEQSGTTPGLERRRLAALGQGKTENPLTIPEQVDPVGPLDIVGDRKNGVQEGVYRKLRLGKYECSEHLDLHRVRVHDAADQVQGFLEQAFKHNHRTVLITHGKGIHSERPGVMKSYVMHWLKQSDLVLAWHSAQPRHGGTGATYVLIRKSADARQKNREQFSQS